MRRDRVVGATRDGDAPSPLGTVALLRRWLSAETLVHSRRQRGRVVGLFDLLVPLVGLGAWAHCAAQVMQRGSAAIEGRADGLLKSRTRHCGELVVLPQTRTTTTRDC